MQPFTSQSSQPVGSSAGDKQAKRHDNFYSSHGKRLVLIADDELINRDILGHILAADYEVIYASDGPQTLAMIRQYSNLLSLVLLDLMMPGMSGQEVLRQIKGDRALQRIPVIVLTADQQAEVECLTLGAVDFIPKPYPAAEVILARVLRTIELSEDRQIIHSTERDPLTGLYNKEYFYQYAEQYDRHHSDVAMDAIVIDVHHFHIINERFGMAYGDTILRLIGEKARDAVVDLNGIVCRREADTFMIYCPHGADHKAILESASAGLTDDSAANHVRLRMGVYVNVDKSLDIVRRFDRAKMAADTIRGNMTKTIAIYDDALRERELYAERLVDDFRRALEEKQFQVFYQPKYNIRSSEPALCSAEALVRWQHPELGMISPGVFIPLFEENGLIQELDRYVWRTAAEQIRRWRDALGVAVPVSVNVSRIDMYDPQLTETLQQIVRQNGLDPRDLYLEITESAYTGDSNRILEPTNALRALGFRIEMDDFGSGYSSLNMISTLPIDVLKLDMQFIRNAFKEGGNTRMIEVIMDIAGYLAVPVVAEGVETEEQMRTLRALGCDIVQGYYFSKPVPAEAFEPFLLQSKRQPPAEAAPVDRLQFGEGRRGGVTYTGIAHALSQDFFSIYYVDTETDWFAEYSSRDAYRLPGIEKSGDNFFERSRKNVSQVIYPEDQARFLALFTKQNILQELAANRVFTMTYRLATEGAPSYVRLKAARMLNADDKHIVIGVTDANAEMNRR